MSQSDQNITASQPSPDEDLPRFMATQICRGFVEHDRGNHAAAHEAFEAVDRLQFPHLEEEHISPAAEAFVDALWAKDNIEFQYLREGEMDQEGIQNADWSPVRQKFRERAALLEIDPEYAVLKTKAWKRHKAGGDYWTPFLQAQLYELRAALQDPEYGVKPKDGQSGFGPEAHRYVLGVELHDMHTDRHWKQAVQAMIPYFELIVEEQDNDE